MPEINDRLDIARKLDDIIAQHYRDADEDGFVVCTRCGRKVSTKYNEEIIEHEAEHFDSDI